MGRALFAPAYSAGEARPNNARFVFLEPAARTFFREWDLVAADTVALLRAEAGRHPRDREVSDLVGELATRSDDFRVLWAAHDVRIHSTGTKRLRHPVVGDLELPYESLPLTGTTTPASLTTYLPEIGSASHDALTLLATWHATDGARDQRISNDTHPGEGDTH